MLVLVVFEVCSVRGVSGGGVFVFFVCVAGAIFASGIGI